MLVDTEGSSAERGGRWAAAAAAAGAAAAPAAAAAVAAGATLDMTAMKGWPSAAHEMASPVPVLPDVSSTTGWPTDSSPLARASSSIWRAILPPDPTAVRSVNSAGHAATAAAGHRNGRSHQKRLDRGTHRSFLLKPGERYSSLAMSRPFTPSTAA